MTREEQINEAVNTYMNDLLEDGAEIPIEDFENIEARFIIGAEWADNFYLFRRKRFPISSSKTSVI